MFDEQTRRAILGEVHESGTTVRLCARIVVVIEDGEQTRDDFGVELLLERALEVSRHLSQRIARRIAHARVLQTIDATLVSVPQARLYRVFEEHQDAVDEIVENRSHFLVATFTGSGQSHQTSVSVTPVR